MLSPSAPPGTFSSSAARHRPPTGRTACCVDDSPGSARAVATTGRLAALLGAELTLVHVIAPPLLLPRDAVARTLAAPPGRDAATAAVLAAHADGHDGWEQAMLTGAPAPSVRRWAEEAGVDPIVAGPRAEGGWGSGASPGG